MKEVGKGKVEKLFTKSLYTMGEGEERRREEVRGREGGTERERDRVNTLVINTKDSSM